MSTTAASPPLDDPLAESLINLLRRASLATLTALADAMATLDLRVIDMATLRVVGANPGCSQAEIGRVLGVQRTNMVPIVAALVERGHLERRIADGRTHALELTAAGTTLLAQAEALGAAIEARHFGALSTEERTALRQTLATICAADCG